MEELLCVSMHDFLKQAVRLIGRPVEDRTVQVEKLFLNEIQVHPHISPRKVPVERSITHIIVSQILKDHRLFSNQLINQVCDENNPQA